MNIMEATRQFQRRANDIIEQADAVKLGLEVIGMQGQRIQQLEQHIGNSGGTVPAPPGQPMAPMRATAGGPAGGPDNVTPMDDGK